MNNKPTIQLFYSNGIQELEQPTNYFFNTLGTSTECRYLIILLADQNT